MGISIESAVSEAVFMGVETGQKSQSDTWRICRYDQDLINIITGKLAVQQGIELLIQDIKLLGHCGPSLSFLLCNARTIM